MEYKNKQQLSMIKYSMHFLDKSGKKLRQDLKLYDLWEHTMWQHHDNSKIK